MDCQAPLDAAAEINRLLANTVVDSVEVREGTLDLAIRFSSGHVFEIIVDSSGYEAWHLCGDGREFIACGGNLAIFDTPTPGQYAAGTFVIPLPLTPGPLG